MRKSIGGFIMPPRGSSLAAPLGVDWNNAPGGCASDVLGPKASAGVSPIVRNAAPNSSFFVMCHLFEAVALEDRVRCTRCFRECRVTRGQVVDANAASIIPKQRGRTPFGGSLAPSA